ncbi:MAG: DUF308 domain-containing protein [Chloroflexota bacterium]
MQNGRTVIYTNRSLPWWTLAIPGVLAVLVGIYMIFQTENFVQLITMVIGFFVLVNGIAAIVNAIRPSGDSGRRLAALIRGILGIVIGALALTLPFMVASLTWEIMLAIVGIQLIIAALLEIYVAYRLRERGAPMGPAITSAIFSLLLAALLFYAPAAIANAAFTFIGILVILFGLGMIGLGWRLRSRHQVVAQ